MFDFSKNLNIPGIIPKTVTLANEFVLFPHEMEAIKQKAKDYIPQSVSNDDIVIMETNRGTMKLKLFPDVAPKHCRNFKKLANSGFYDKTTFHRILWLACRHHTSEIILSQIWKGLSMEVSQTPNIGIFQKF